MEIDIESYLINEERKLMTREAHIIADEQAKLNIISIESLLESSISLNRNRKIYRRLLEVELLRDNDAINKRINRNKISISRRDEPTFFNDKKEKVRKIESRMRIVDEKSSGYNKNNDYFFPTKKDNHNHSSNSNPFGRPFFNNSSGIPFSESQNSFPFNTATNDHKPFKSHFKRVLQ
ncbi:hypothetical protein M9Y10_035177 [Tritrichomonas musculus]|uniref:Uncharacterized protein n=1 Tax=Tritrichomonas musculus TaxID=1915356 RepID=A0ABR2KHT7_9EUKA